MLETKPNLERINLRPKKHSISKAKRSKRFRQVTSEID